MSTPSKSQTPSAGAGRRPQRDASTIDSTPARSPSRTGGKNTPTPSNSAARPRSTRTTGAGTPISARSAVKKPANGSSNATNVRNGPDPDAGGTGDDDTRAQTAAAIEELQDRLRRAEEASDEYQKQVTLLQARVRDSNYEQGRLEDTVHELTERVEELDNQKRDSLRSRREVEAIYESDKAASLRYRDDAQAREDELLETIQRLKESLATRESRFSVEEERKPAFSRTSSFRGASPHVDAGHFAPSSSLQRSDSRSSSRLVYQKDKIIEGLKMELAEAQIKLVEMENMGGGQVAVLEKNLMETRVDNARLMEENESFQLLLSEKTLNGDLAHSSLLSGPTPTDTLKGNSLADELAGADDADDDGTRHFKVQIASLKDENKALTLYINNIISRLLQHDIDFILDKNPEAAPRKPSQPAEKDLPPPPPEKNSEDEGLLARTRSVMGGGRPRPQSVIMTEVAPPTPHENPETAPSIPLTRPQPRSASGNQKRMTGNWDSAAVVNTMYRGPSPTRASGQLSPSITSPRNSFFAPRPQGSSRGPSGSTVPTISEADKEKSPHRPNRDSKISSGRNSVISDAGSNPHSNSPPASTTGGSDKGDKGASSVMIGSKMRPLRLVQGAADEDAARKAANRTSWMGWFNKT